MTLQPQLTSFCGGASQAFMLVSLKGSCPKSYTQLHQLKLIVHIAISAQSGEPAMPVHPMTAQS
jgi:hypothetical protein